MNHLHFLLPLLALVALISSARAQDTRNRNVLKFGITDKDYIMYKPDMKPMESALTICTWVKKLDTSGKPTWLSYGVSSEVHEIQITDMGSRIRLFGDDSDLRSRYLITPGDWFHNCLSWSAASKTRHVYINGVLVDSKATPAGRTLRQDGYLVIGNEQATTYGTGMDYYNAFGGELYKLNVFSKMLTTTEIKEMAKNMCSNVEEMHGAARSIRWEDILQESRSGNVTEIPSGCEDTIFTKMKKKLEQTEKKLNETISELEAALTKIDELEKALNTSCQLNETVTSHWDLLYSNKFYGETLTTEAIEEVRRSLEKIEFLVGVKVSDKIIDFFKRYFN